MLGLGFWEIVIIGLVGLIIVGPEKLPELAKSAAKFLNEMKRTASDFQNVINQEKDVFKDDIDQFQKLAQSVTKIEDIENSVDLHTIPSTTSEAEQLELQPQILESTLSEENLSEPHLDKNTTVNSTKNSKNEGH
jgi:sec-independent protein translocase protein TatB